MMAHGLQAQVSQKKLIENINEWYEEYEQGYFLTLTNDKTTASIKRYHPERPEEKDDIIEIKHGQMKIVLKFDSPIAEITTHPDSLQKHFSYVSISRIYNDIPSKGWDIYPRTPQSSMRGKGVKFTSGGDAISLKINWQTYTVMGYKDSQKCHDQLSIEDGAVSEDCYTSVRKKIPLEITITDVRID